MEVVIKMGYYLNVFVLKDILEMFVKLRLLIVVWICVSMEFVLIEGKCFNVIVNEVILESFVIKRWIYVS